ncbi:MAG: type 1 glutamine amidotransferase [Brevundimonas sp.]|uniref:type 1 glutamine amidotransferase n=1 Tax=Brevundimonas sp. TaxID=1871086 RepID=UPI0018364C01|nr:type 1 glutamine amidotransferase [Brevundimonas sp.]MBA4803987.1 type 1 glutamine amidotransferase [Brevundimonas sp.]
MTRIAILETGAPPADLRAEHGDYPSMFRALLGPGFDVAVFDVQAGELPDPAAFDGAIITGSPAGVYEDHAWIPPLLDWIRSARGRVRLVGICFGHQAMAQALGGRVEKSDRGWGVGLHSYDVRAGEPWMQPPAAFIAIPVSHQDQVVEAPVDARVTLASDFAPFAGLAWGTDAISFQCHPEFSPAYAAALVAGRAGRIPAPVVDEALASLTGPDDRPVLSAWIRAFLTGAAS